jgi:CRP-like cAMP-binding protein
MHICEICPLRASPLFLPFTPAELRFMMAFREGTVDIERGSILFHEGDSLDSFYTVLSGQGARYKTLENGDRQLVNFVFPGDLVGLAGTVTGATTATMQAASPMRLCRFRKARLPELFTEQPDRAYAIAWIAAVEEHFLGETIATLGRRNASERLAWALLKVYQRLAAVGLADETGAVPFPYRQSDLADALGLSVVHTNKMLARLRPLARLEDRRLSVSDQQALADLAMVSGDKLTRRPLL